MAGDPTFTLPKIELDTAQQDEPKPFSLPKFDLTQPVDAGRFQLPKIDLSQPVDATRFQLPKVRLDAASSQDLYKPIAPTPTPVATQEPLQPEPMTPLGFTKNVLDQAWDIGKGLVTGTVAGYSKLIQTPLKTYGEILTHPKAIIDGVWDTVKNIANATFGSESDYAKHGVRVLYDKPLTPVLDAMTIISLGGAGTTRLGRLAGGVSRAGMTGEELAKAGELSAADRVVALGEKMSAIPGQIGRKVFEAPIRAVGLNPESLNFLRSTDAKQRALTDLERAGLKQELDPLLKQIRKSPEMEQQLDRALTEIMTPEEFDALPQSVKQVREAWERIQSAREGYLTKNLGRTQEALDSVVAKKYSARKYGDISPENVAKAAEEIAAAKQAGLKTPLYTPALVDRSVSVADLLDELKYPSNIQKVGGGPSFLKPYKGGKGTLKPSEYIPKTIDEFLEVKRKINFNNELKAEGYLRPAKPGETPLSHVMPEGLGKKYLQYEPRAQAAELGNIRRTEGVDQAVASVLNEADTAKYIKPITELAAKDSTVASYMKWSFYQAPGPWKAIIRGYDKLLGALKAGFTVYNPKWVTGNVVGDGILSAMASYYGLEWKTVEKIIDHLPANLRPGVRSLSRELAEGGTSNRIADFLSSISQNADNFSRNGIWTKEVAAKIKNSAISGAISQDALVEALKRIGDAPGLVTDIFNQIQNIDEALIRKVPSLRKAEATVERFRKSSATTEAEWREMVEAHKTLLQSRSAIRDKVIEAGELEKRIPELKQFQDISNHALRRANDFLGDYLGQGPIERSVFRRIVPFYPWVKAMTQLAFKLPFIAPKNTFLWNRYAQVMMDMVNDPDLPDKMKGYIPTHIRQNGDVIWLRLGGLMPLSNMASARWGDIEIPRILAFWEHNPVLSVILRGAGLRNEFFWAGHIPTDEPVVALNDGTVAQFTKDGRIETVIPQEGPVHQALGLFPAVQFMRQVISDYDINKGPSLNPDGSYQFPVEMWQRLLSITGAKTLIKNPDELKMIERKWTAKRIQELRQQLKYASPERREQILQILNDRAGGYYRTRAANF